MRSITVRTNQNVQVDYELAPTMSRVGAFVLDILFFFAIYVVMLLVIRPVLTRGSTPSSDRETFIYAFLPLFLFLIYYFLSEMLSRGQTVGKRILAIQVIRVEGRELTPGDFLLRTFMLLPDAIFSLGIPAVILINSTPKAQRLGDMVANTAVIQASKQSTFSLSDILRIKTRANYEPRFPEVTRLSESDMMLIKRGLQRFEQHTNDAHRRAIIRMADIVRDKLELTPEREGGAAMPPVQLLRTLIKDYIVLTR